MSKCLEYSVLRYTPILVAGEHVNIGVLFSSDNFQEFHSIKKFSRIKSFDDELDINALKFLISSIKNDIQLSLYNEDKKFNINDFTKYYMNEFHFSKPIKIAFTDLAKTIDDITKLYLKYDYEKNNRLSELEQKQLIKKILESSHKSYKQNKKIKGNFGDQITYDIIFNNYGIKFFNFKNKSINHMMNDIKAWAWNCENTPKNLKTIIIYSQDFNGNEEYNANVKTCIDILKKSSDNIFDFEAGLSLIEKFVSKQEFSKEYFS